MTRHRRRARRRNRSLPAPRTWRAPARRRSSDTNPTASWLHRQLRTTKDGGRVRLAGEPETVALERRPALTVAARATRRRWRAGVARAAGVSGRGGIGAGVGVRVRAAASVAERQRIRIRGRRAVAVGDGPL